MTTVPPTLQDARALDVAALDSLLTLNNAHAEQLSYLTLERFRTLLDSAWLSLVAEDRSALLLAFDHHAAYDGLNFFWFRDRWPRFAYVDRIVVAPAARGRGLARVL